MTNLHTAVQKACASNNLKELSALDLDKHAVLAQDAQGNTALLLAAAAGNITVIKFLDDLCDRLLGYHAFKIFSVRNKEGYNPLSIAAKNQHTAAVVTLYELGAYDSFTANEFDWKIYANMQIDPKQDTENVARRLKEDAQKRLSDIYKKTLYNEVTAAHTRIDDLRRAIHNIQDVNAVVYDEHSALYHAIRAKNVTAIKVLLEEGASIEPDMLPLVLDSKNNEVFALIGQHLPLTAQAIDWGEWFDVLFEHAIRTDDAKVVEHLLPHITTTKLQDALLYSAEIDSPAVVKCLLKHNVDVNCRENSRRARTPAMLAAKKGNVDILAILIAHGANLSARSESGVIRGLTALDYAKIYRRRKCVQVLLAAMDLKGYSGLG